jgi:hypothetical protein
MQPLHTLIWSSRVARGWSRARLARQAARFAVDEPVEPHQIRWLEEECSSPPPAWVLVPVVLALGIPPAAVLDAVGYRFERKAG